MSMGKGSAAFIAAAVTMFAGHAAAAPVERTTDLSFSTRGQSLFGPFGGVTRTESLRFDVLNEQREQLRKGRIVNSQVPLSLATTVAIWQRAIDICRSQSYTLTVAGVDLATFSPSETECINGEIRRNYCVVPPHLGWDACPDPFGGNRKTWVRDLGPGIGPKPTSGTSRPYDFGAIVTMSSDLRVGFEGSYQYDLGSVDVDYSARAQLRVDNDTAAPGELVTITTSHTDRTPYVMNSRYPSFELALDMYAYARMAVDAEYAGVNQSNGDPVRQTRTLYAIDTRDNPSAIDGFMPFTNGTERLFGVRLDSTGLTRTILGVSDHVESRYEYTLTWPFNAPEQPDKKAPRYTWPVSFSLLELAFSVPQLDTPVAPGFLCGDCVPLRNFVSGGVLTNTAPTGARTLLGGITDGNGIKLPFVNDGVQDTDLVRVDVDLDAITVAAGVPLGAIVQDPLGILEAEVNLLELDFATFISADQRLSFEPKLQVELRFSKEVEVRAAGDADFARAASLVVPVGESVIFRQPEGGVSVTPVYTLRDNAFINDTQLKISNALQETLGQVKLGGFVGDGLGSILGEDANFAMLQITPTLYDPVSIWNNDATPFSLGGFADHVDAAIAVNTPSTGGGGSSSSGGGSGSSSSGGSSSGGGAASSSGGSNGGGGGGAWDLTSLAVLWLAAWLAARLRYHAAACRSRRQTSIARC